MRILLALNVLAAATLWSGLTLGAKGGAAFLSFLLLCAALGARGDSPFKRGGVAAFTPKPPKTAGEAPVGSVITVNGQRLRVTEKFDDLVRVTPEAPCS